MNLFTHYPHLFEPIKIGPLTSKNRIMVPPMGPRIGAPSFKIGALDVAYYEERAKSGAGIITIPGVAPDSLTAPSLAANYMIEGPGSTAELSKLAKAIHRHGAIASVEISHEGYAANFASGRPLAVSESIASHGDFAEFTGAKAPKVMELSDIEYLIRIHVQAAKICQEAGFDMLMLPCGHGELPHQFLSPITNRREDKYGGTPEKRMTFLVELLTAIKEACGPNFPIHIRVSANDKAPGGYETDYMIQVLKKVEHLVDLVEVSNFLTLSPDNFSPYYVKRDIKVNLEDTKKIKAAISVPVCAMGGYTLLEDGEKVLEDGYADMISYGKASMARVQLFKKAAMGATDEDVVPCVRCLRCVTDCTTLHAISCTVNPRLGNEFSYPSEARVDQPRNIVIVGGGPAGMEAALIGVRRGHQVTLLERNAELGGRLDVVSAQSFKEEYRMYKKWIVKETMNSGADVRLNTEATPELIKELAPDVLIVAVGGESIVPSSIPVDNKKVVLVEDVDLHKVETGENVLIIGGGISGVESAIDLADSGKKVTIVDRLPMVLWAGSAPLYTLVYAKRIELLMQKGITVLPETSFQRVSENGAIVSDASGEERELTADTVILALGVRKNPDQLERLSNIVPETYFIGDAREVGDVYSATHDAYFCVMDL